MANDAENRYEDAHDAEEEMAAEEAIEERNLTTLERLAEQFGKKVLSTSSRLGEATAVVDAKSLGKITDAAKTGPDKAPLPASSTPQMLSTSLSS